MSDNEILLALSNMLEPVRVDMQEIKCDIKQMDKRLLKVEQTQDQMDKCLQKMDQRLRKIEVNQENDILPRLRTIEACYTSTFDRYKDSVEGYEILKQDVSILKDVVTKHSKKLQKIS